MDSSVEVKDLEVKEVKKSKWSKIRKSFKALPKIIKYGIIVLIVITLCSTGTMFGVIFKNETKSTKFGLENVGELITQTAHLTIVEDSKVSRDFFSLFEIPFTESRQIFSYDIDVDASLDFSKITYQIDKDNKQIKMKIPHSKVYKTTLNLESLKVFLDEESLFSRIDLKKHNQAQIEMKRQGEEDAINNGLLVAADKNAKSLIESLIKSNSDFKNYSIVYEYVGE